MGTPLAELDVKENTPKTLLNSVPKPHPKFDNYAVWGSTESGVCAVIALSKLYEDDRFGINVRSDINEIASALEKVYGKSELVDFRHPSGIWDDVDEWVMSIKQNERVYSFVFEDVGSTQQGANLDYLEATVVALSSDTSMIKLQYKFENFDQCEKEINAEANSSF